jgi:hypothetical protein
MIGDFLELWRCLQLVVTMGAVIFHYVLFSLF